MVGKRSPFCVIRVVLWLGIVLSACSSGSGPLSEDGGPIGKDVTHTGQTPEVTAETEFHLSPIQDLQCSRVVAPYGADANPGSEDLPWGSFQYAADRAQPGDTVCFRDGVYQTEDIHLTTSGQGGGVITFAAFPNERPILDGGGSAHELLVFNQGVSHIRISGFQLSGFQIWGVLLSGENHHIYLDHLEITGGEASIRMTYSDSAEVPPLEGTVDHILIEDSLIHGSQYSAVDCTPGPCDNVTIRRVEIFNTGMVGEAFFGSDGIEFARGERVLVEDCYVHDNGGDGIDLGSRDREGHSTGIIVRNNRVGRNRLNGIKLWAGGRIENNLLWGQGDSAIWSGSFDCTIEIIHNKVAFNMWDAQYANRNWAVVVGYPEEIPKPAVQLTMVNNIFAFNADLIDGGPTGVYLGPGVSFVEGHNIYFSNPEEEITLGTGDGIGFSREDIRSGRWGVETGQGEGNVVENPFFTSGWPNVDLHLLPGSPALDAGSFSYGALHDIDGKMRDTFPNMGAYEE